MTVVGFVTDRGEAVCLGCRAELRPSERVEPIVDPAPDGIYRPGQHSDRYDDACVFCGWPIRRAS